MTDINEQPLWEESISLISRSEKVEGGQNGPANRATKQLANRTLFLKQNQDNIGDDLAGKVSAINDFAVGATLESPRDEILHGAYRLVWTGEFPKVVPAESSPETTGGVGVGRWAYTSDVVIREDLVSNEPTLGASLVMTRLGVCVQDALIRRQGNVVYLSDLAPGVDLSQNSVDIVPLLTKIEPGSVVYIGAGHFKFGSDLDSPLELTLVGVNGSSYIKPIPASTESRDGGKISLETPGTWIHIDNPTISERSVQLHEGGCFGIAFFDDRQDFKDWAAGNRTDPDGNLIYEPVITGSALTLTGTSAKWDSLMFLNCYDAMSVGKAASRPQHIHAGDVHISPIKSGLKIWGLGAGGSIDRIHVYPTWSQMWNFAGESYRVNRFADSLAVAYQGGDQGDPQTFEQLIIKDVCIIGVGDGLLLGGKGTRVLGGRIDNCMRPITGKSTDNSAYHVINNMWATSFYGYTEKTRNDGSFYLLKNEGAGGIQVDNFVSPRADGYGIWMWGQATNSQISNVELYNVGFKGFEFGRPGITSGTLSVRDLYVQCRDSTVIPYTWYDWAAIDGGGLHYQGVPATVSQYLGVNSQEFSGRTRIDLSSIAKRSIDINPEGWVRYGVTTGSDELVIRSPASNSSIVIPFERWTVRNQGGTNSSAGIGVANANTAGNGYGRMELRASIAGVLTSLWQLNTNGLFFGPINDNQIDLGTPATRVKQFYGVNSSVMTSDANHKTDPRNVSDEEISAFWEIGQLPWVWQWLMKYQSEGEGARLHSGPTVQAAIAVMEKHNLDWNQYSAFCYDKWDEVKEEVVSWDDEYDEGGVLIRSAGSCVVQEHCAAGEVYSFRKDELLMWILRATIEKQKSLERRLHVLEG